MSYALFAIIGYPTIAQNHAKSFEPPPYPDSVFIREWETRGSETIRHEEYYCTQAAIEEVLQHFQSYGYKFEHTTSVLADGSPFEEYTAYRDSESKFIRFLNDLATFQYVPGVGVRIVISPKWNECDELSVIINRDWSEH